MIVDVEINSVLNKLGTKITEEAASLCLDIVEEKIKEI